MYTSNLAYMLKIHKVIEKATKILQKLNLVPSYVFNSVYIIRI